MGVAASLPTLFVAGAICCVPAVCFGQYQSESEIQPPAGAATPSGWDATLGLGLAAAPRYPGADDYRAWPAPIAMVRYRDVFFAGPQGVGLNLIDVNGWRAGPIVGVQDQRRETSDSHLASLGSIPLSATAGGFVSYAYGPFEISGLARQSVIHTQNGLTGWLTFKYRSRPFQKCTLTVGPELNFADREYEQTWFGVTPAQSANSGLPVYTPHGGLMDLGFHMSLTYRYAEHVLLHSFVDVRRFEGDAADSPIVFIPTQARAGVGVAYHF